MAHRSMKGSTTQHSAGDSMTIVFPFFAVHLISSECYRRRTKSGHHWLSSRAKAAAVKHVSGSTAIVLGCRYMCGAFIKSKSINHDANIYDTHIFQVPLTYDEGRKYINTYGTSSTR